MDIEQFKDRQPRFVPEEYFLGELTGQGMFINRSGSLVREFTLDLEGTLGDDGNLRLAEVLRWKDGTVENRVYSFTKLSEGRYRAEAEGLVGAATIEAQGNALHWRYTLEVRGAQRSWVLDFDDWMFLTDSGVMLNRAKAYKWGIFVGEVIISMSRQSSAGGVVGKVP